jgi:hypothetical protein
MKSFIRNKSKKQAIEPEVGENVSTSHVIVGGSNLSLAKRAGRSLRVLFRRKSVVVSVVLLGVFGIAAGIYYVNLDQQEDLATPNEIVDYKTMNVQAEKQLIASKKESTATPPSPDSSPEDKELYYSDKIWLLLKEGDNTKVAKFYVDEVQEQELEFGLDINEALIRPLMVSGYNDAAKSLIDKILETYRVSSNTTTDLATNTYINEKIAYYEGLEATL